MANEKDLIISGNGKYVQVFAPREGISLTSPYLASEDIIVCIATPVTITLDTVEVAYDAGSIIGLAKGVTYTLSATTAAHKM